jgi:hypothetical protein
VAPWKAGRLFQWLFQSSFNSRDCLQSHLWFISLVVLSIHLSDFQPLWGHSWEPKAQSQKLLHDKNNITFPVVSFVRHLPLWLKLLCVLAYSLPTPNKGPKSFPGEQESMCEKSLLILETQLCLPQKGTCSPSQHWAQELGSTQAPFVPLMSHKCLAWAPASSTPIRRRGWERMGKTCARSALLSPGRTAPTRGAVRHPLETHFTLISENPPNAYS